MFLTDNIIDVSGVAGKEVFVGLACIDSHCKAKIQSDFYKKFSDLKHSK